MYYFLNESEQGYSLAQGEGRGVLSVPSVGRYSLSSLCKGRAGSDMTVTESRTLGDSFALRIYALKMAALGWQ